MISAPALKVSCVRVLRAVIFGELGYFCCDRPVRSCILTPGVIDALLASEIFGADRSRLLWFWGA